jgi:type IV pilus assembly protein PilO
MAPSLADLSKVPTKQKAFVVVLLSAMLAVGYYYLFFAKANAENVKLSQQLDGLRSKIREQEVIARNLRSFQAEVARLETELAILLEQLPNSAEIPSLLRNVSDVGRDSGLEFLKFTPKGEAKKEFYAEIPVAMTVHGDFFSFVTFADKVGRLPRIVNLTGIEFTNPKVGEDNVVPVNVSCSAVTYRFLEASETQKAADAGKPAPRGKGK